MANPVMNLPMYNHSLLEESAISKHPRRNGNAVICTVVFLPNVSAIKPETRAPPGVEITPKLAETSNSNDLSFIYVFTLSLRIPLFIPGSK